MTDRICIGRITLERLPPKDERVLADTDARPYLGALEALTRMLPPAAWALAGGLVVPISVGGFYRRHTDIDIVMPMTRFTDVVDAFRANGYALYTSWSVSHRSRGILLQCRMQNGSRLVRLRPRRLYVKPADEAGGDPLLAKIDLYPYYDRGGCLVTCNSRRVLPGRTMQRSSLAAFARAGHVNCLPLEHVASLKASRSGAKHRLDCAVILDGRDAAREWFRKLTVLPPQPGGQPSLEAAS